MFSIPTPDVVGLQAEGDLQGALRLYERALDAAPNHVPALMASAHLYKAAGCSFWACVYSLSRAKDSGFFV